jgi:hypothetical protein
MGHPRLDLDPFCARAWAANSDARWSRRIPNNVYYRRASFVPVGGQVKEQFTSRAVEGHKPQLVDDQHLDAEEPPLQAPEFPGIAGFQQLRTNSAARVKSTRRFCPTASSPRAIAKCVSPVPMGPAKMRFSARVIHSPRASALIGAGARPSAA